MTNPPAEPLAPADVLERIAFRLEVAGAPRYRARVFRRAAAAVAACDPDELRALAAGGRLDRLPGVGAVTAAIVAEALAGERPRYLVALEAADARLAAETADGAALCDALRGDCHVHSDWSDGRAPIRAMAEAARDLGHDYIVLTDHSPSLKVARGLSPARLREELDVVAALNAELAPFRILTGIEVDILEDGALDQEDELLARLDVVVGSVHSKLRMPAAAMTERLVAALANPHLDVLGHCTGRMRRRRGDRPESEFDAEAVFAAAAWHGKAIEVNAQPARRDPPRRLIRAAAAAGCRFAVDSDAHVPGELAWLPYACDRLASCGVGADRVVNAGDAESLRAWTAAHATAAPERR